ncbi:MAG: hypothetical protein KGL39_22195 [Patescibacteria group bacterium]|nr:hypothetical protein [Patescibacteria group bacterium]
MSWYWWVVIVAALVVATAYTGLTAWSASLSVTKAPRKKLYVCDKHGPTAPFTMFSEPFEWETPEGAKKRGPVQVCALCFEQTLKTAKSKLK